MGCDQMTDTQRAAMEQEPSAIAVKGAIMGAAYAFRDAHLSGSNSLMRSAHAALDMAVDAALRPAHQEPYGYLYEGIASHTRDKTLFKKTPETHLETRWWREVGPVYTAPQLEAQVSKPMKVEINGVVYEPGAATYMCNGCAARYDIGLCSDLTEKFPCDDVIWQTKEIKEPVYPRHPVVVRWRNDGIEACAGIANAYGNADVARDMRAMITPLAPPAEVPMLTAAEILAIMRDGNNCNYNDEGEHIDFAREIEQIIRKKAGIK